MAPSKRSASAKKKKEEVLEDPQKLPNGAVDYYVGGWSYYQSVEQIGDIARSVITAHTRPDREVDPLPRTNVILLPRREGAEDEGDGDTDAVVEIEVADKMHIEGVTRQVIRESAQHVKEWKQIVPEGAPPAVPPATTAAAAPEQALPDEQDGNADGEVDAAPPQPDEGEEPSAALPSTEEEEEKEMVALARLPVPFGANFNARDVVITGSVTIRGALPQVVVHPKLPTAASVSSALLKEVGNATMTSTSGATGKGDSVSTKKATTSKKGSSAGKKRKVLSPEEQAEQERLRAEAEEELQRQTEAAVALAAEQENYLMTFAHPQRWANVVIASVTFTGPVQIVRAHVTFQNCRFLGASAERPQLVVSQFCRVSCVHCTFECPLRCGVYALPTSQVAMGQCLLTGVPQVDLLRLEAAKAATGVGHSALSSSSYPAAGAAAGDEDESVELAADGSGGAGATYATDDTPICAEELHAAMEGLRAAQATSVGVQTDCAKVSLDQCRLLCLGTGVLFRGSDPASNAGSSGKLAGGKGMSLAARAKASGGGKTAAGATLYYMSLTRSVLHHFFSTAVLVDSSARDILLRGNTVSDCAYYGLDCRAGAREVGVYENRFATASTVRVRAGVKPHFLHNALREVPVDDNPLDNPCLEPVY